MGRYSGAMWKGLGGLLIAYRAEKISPFDAAMGAARADSPARGALERPRKCAFLKFAKIAATPTAC